MAKKRRKQKTAPPNAKKQKADKQNQNQPEENGVLLANGDLTPLEHFDLTTKRPMKRARGFEGSAEVHAVQVSGAPQQDSKSYQQEHSQELVALHRVRFVPWEPSAGLGAAVTNDGSLLAVLRENGAIELWDTVASLNVLVCANLGPCHLMVLSCGCTGLI
jgi:hypothetical protein